MTKSPNCNMCEVRMRGNKLPLMTVIIRKKEDGKYLGIQPEYGIRAEGNTMDDIILDTGKEMGAVIMESKDMMTAGPGGYEYNVPMPMLPEDYDDAYDDIRAELEALAGESLPDNPEDLFWASAKPKLLMV